MKKAILLCSMFTSLSFAQLIDSGPRNIYHSASTPASCNVGDIWFNTSAVAGHNQNGCTATNVWTPQGGVSTLIGDQNLNQATNALSTTGNALTGSQLPKFRLALAKTRDGGADTKILFVGDSTTEGIGSTLNGTFVNAGSWPTRIKMSGSASPPVTGGMAVYNIGDGRWTLGTGWTVQGGFGFCNGGNNAGAITENAAAGNLTFTPGSAAGSYDSFVVYYLTNSGNGSVTATATGGSPVTINTNSGGGWGRTTVTASGAATSNAVVIAPVSGAVYIVGVEPFLSTTPSIRKGNVGVSGATTGECANASTFSSLPGIELYAPDLTVISLGINDASASTTAVTLSANLQTIITAAQLSGDVLLVTMPPSQNSTWLSFEVQYVAAEYALAQTDGMPLFDLFQRWGSVYSSLFQSVDGVHPNQSGYWDWESGFDSFLNSVTWK